MEFIFSGQNKHAVQRLSMQLLNNLCVPPQANISMVSYKVCPCIRITGIVVSDHCLLQPCINNIKGIEVSYLISVTTTVCVFDLFAHQVTCCLRTVAIAPVKYPINIPSFWSMYVIRQGLTCMGHGAIIAPCIGIGHESGDR